MLLQLRAIFGFGDEKLVADGGLSGHGGEA
jgi:hypothetical protein